MPIRNFLEFLSPFSRELRGEVYLYLLPRGYGTLRTTWPGSKEASQPMGPQIDRKTPTPSQIDVKPATSLGNLSSFPRELRDEIYSYLLPQGYSTLWVTLEYHGGVPYSRPGGPSFCRPERPKRPSSNLTILRLSKQIHSEAIVLLYSKGTFGFYAPRYANRKLEPLPSRSIADRITNVAFYVDLDPWRDRNQDVRTEKKRVNVSVKTFSTLRPGPIAFFSGTSRCRKTALIEITPQDYSSYMTHMVSSPLFAAVKQFTGFRTVTVRICAGAPWLCPPRGMFEYGAFPWGRAGRYTSEAFEGMMPLLEAFKTALEPTLGKGVVGEETGLWETRTRDLVFHPMSASLATSGDHEATNSWSSAYTEGVCQWLGYLAALVGHE